jgi:hypothetical protein
MLGSDLILTLEAAPPTFYGSRVVLTRGVGHAKVKQFGLAWAPTAAALVSQIENCKEAEVVAVVTSKQQIELPAIPGVRVHLCHPHLGPVTLELGTSKTNFPVLDGSIADLKGALNGGTLDALLDELEEAEVAAKSRKGALRAIEARRSKLAEN